MCLDNDRSACANYHAHVLCDDTICTSGLGCGNRFISTYRFEVEPTDIGLGLIASTDLPKGVFLLEYVGEMIYEDTKLSRNQDYIMELSTRTKSNRTKFIDARICGNESRFVNHSCQPNRAWYEFVSCSGPRVGIFSDRDIEVGECNMVATALVLYVGARSAAISRENKLLVCM